MATFASSYHLAREYQIKVLGKRSYLYGEEVLFDFEDVRQAAVKGHALLLEIIPWHRRGKVDFYMDEETKGAE